MDKLLIRGGRRLSGQIKISGAKNAALPILAATLLTDKPCVLENVPQVRDVDTISALLGKLGSNVERDNPGIVTSSKAKGFEAPYDLVRTMRASILVLGPLVARYGRARVSLPGGCAIGARPVNLHLHGLEMLGAKIHLEGGYIKAEAPRLKGAEMWLDLPTVTGTENLMMAAVLAEGETVIENAAIEPEIVDLASALGRMGARIDGAGTPTVRVQGVSELGGLRYRIMPDRIEAGTYMVAAAITQGDIELLDCQPEHLHTVTAKLRETGVTIEEGDRQVRVRAQNRPQPTEIKTAPYPGFPTDMQAQVMALSCLAEGTSVITEMVFENRFMHVLELDRLGADIIIEGHSAIVRGVDRLYGAPVMATDLRASASLVLAGLAAQGETVISRVYHLDRGYERMEEKLGRLGADIRRIK